MGCDLTISTQKLLEGLFGVLERLFEAKSLVSSLGINKWVHLECRIRVKLHSKGGSLALVLGDELVEAGWLGEAVNLCAIKFIHCEGNWSFLVMDHCIDIAYGKIDSTGEFILVVDDKPSLDGLGNVRFQNGSDLQLRKLLILEDFVVLSHLGLGAKESCIVGDIRDLTKLFLCFVEWNGVYIFEENIVLAFNCWHVQLEALLSIDLHDFVKHAQPFLVIFCDLALDPLLNLG